MAVDRNRLIEIAQLVSDGTSVDWHDLESTSDRETLKMIRRLRRVELVAQAHRRLVTDESGKERSGQAGPRESKSWRASAGSMGRVLHGFTPGDAFAGRYTIVEQVGAGGMGVVYKAHDRDLETIVALKMIREDMAAKPDKLVRFRRELGMARQVAHPNVCRVHDLGESDGIPFFSMEYLDGQTLQGLIQKLGPLSIQQTLHLTKQICAGLAAIHQAGIVHRDLKPSNIGVASDGRVAVMDFGIARRTLDPSVTKPGVVVGSYAYMAPEQVQGKEAEPRTDIYALGLLMYEMMTALRPPGDNDARPLAFRGEHAELPPPSRFAAGVPFELDRLVLRCLSWHPAERPSSAFEVQDELGKPNVSATASRGGVAAKRTPMTKRWLQPALVALGVMLSLYLLFWIFNPRDRGISSTPSRPAPSIAVLPFSFAEAESEYGYLGELMADGLTAGLQSASAVRVAPYEAVLALAQDGHLAAHSVGRIAEDLGVDWIVRGTLTREGSRFLLNTQLVSANGATVSESRMSGLAARPLPTLDSLRQSLLQALPIALEGELKSISQVRTPSPEAYDKYLAARRYHENWDIEDQLTKAIDAYEQATDLDPEFAAAYAGLAKALVTLYYQTEEPALIASARAESQIALSLNANLPEVRVASGFVEEVSGNTVLAEIELRKAIELAPGNDTAYRVMADFYADLGRHEEAQRYYDRAVALRPGSWRNHYKTGRYYFVFGGDIQKAESHLLKAYEYHPTGVGPKVYLGNIALNTGDLDAAETWYRRVLDHGPDPWAQYYLGKVYYYRGQYELAHRSFLTATEGKPDFPVFHSVLADALSHLGEAEEAQRHYDEASRLYEDMLTLRPDDFERRASYATLLATRGQCDQALGEIRRVLFRNPDSFEFVSAGAFTMSVCGELEEATGLALRAIEAGTSVVIRFDPNLDPLRSVPVVRDSLQRAQN